MEHAEVVVVGAGVVGAATAWWLARRGYDVVVLERFEAGHRRGSSHGTERIFRFTYPDPLYVRLAVEALPLWRELEAESGQDLFTTTGMLDIGPPAQLAAIESACRAVGVTLDHLTGDEVHDRWPALRFAGPVLHHAEGGRTDADATVATLLERTAALGGSVRVNSPVDAIQQRSSGVELRMGGARLGADVAVVCAAGWTPALLPRGIPLRPITTTLAQVAFFTPLPQAQPDRGDPIADLAPSFIDDSVYGMATPDGRIKIGEYDPGPLVDPDNRSFEADPDGTDRLTAWADAHLEGVDPVPSDTLTCLFASTDDDDFVIDRHGDVVVGCGFGGHGFKFAPLLGQMLADVAVGRPLASPWGERFSLDRPPPPT